MSLIQWREYGDAAWLAKVSSSSEAAMIAETIRSKQFWGVRDCYAAFDKILVTVNPLDFDAGFQRVELVAQEKSQINDPDIVIPVCYDLGDDLAEVCSELQLSKEEFVSEHTSQNYSVLAIGFTPGFGYCGYLPDRVSGVSRLATPRTKVPPGSVAITERFSAVYPAETPGGWKIIGKTPAKMVSIAEDFFLLKAGVSVRYQAIPLEEYRRLRGEQP